MSDDAQPEVPKDIFLGTTNYTVRLLGAGGKSVFDDDVVRRLNLSPRPTIIHQRPGLGRAKYNLCFTRMYAS